MRDQATPSATEPSGATEPSLSLSEWLVLCLICEQPAHGFALAGLLGRDGSLGQIWRVPKPVIYRGLQHLETLGLVSTVGEQATSQGPVRSLVAATPAGQLTALRWLRTPVSHARDVRSELLVKLALLDRVGGDPQPLVAAQYQTLVPIAQALEARLAAAAGFERTLLLWRYETMSATLRFLDALRDAQPGGPAAG